MILTVNIGNTHITIAGYEHDTLQFSGRLHSSPAATVDEYAMNLLNLLSLYQVAPERIEGGILGSVVPALTGRVLGALRMLCSARFLTVGPGLKSGIKLRLDNPAQLGAELLCGAVAALEEGPGPLAVISADTAISIMAVNGRQELVGGVILPGPQLSLSALVQKTAQLPQIDLSAPASSSILGKNTSACLQNGWPGYPLLCHRQPAPHHPGGLPHAHSVPGVSDHGRPIPHLAEKSERVISKSKGVLHHEFQTCISALLSNHARELFRLYQGHTAGERRAANQSGNARRNQRRASPL